MGYLANFMVYTFAMIGVIAVALMVFKKSTTFNGGTKSKHIRVVDTLTLSPRKTLYIISTGSEKFLIAGDVDKTSLISKLEMEMKDMSIVEVSSQFNSSNIPELKNEQAFELNKLYSQNSTDSLASISSIMGGKTYPAHSFKDAMMKAPKSSGFTNKSNYKGIESSLLNNTKDSQYTSVIKNLALKMRQ